MADAMSIPPSDGQIRALRALEDGAWHPSTRTGAGSSVIGTVGSALVRAGLAERRGASRTAKPSNPGYEYRITAAGRLALQEHRR